MTISRTNKKEKTSKFGAKFATGNLHLKCVTIFQQHTQNTNIDKIIRFHNKYPVFARFWFSKCYPRTVRAAPLGQMMMVFFVYLSKFREEMENKILPNAEQKNKNDGIEVINSDKIEI